MTSVPRKGKSPRYARNVGSRDDEDDQDIDETARQARRKKRLRAGGKVDGKRPRRRLDRRPRGGTILRRQGGGDIADALPVADQQEQIFPPRPNWNDERNFHDEGAGWVHGADFGPLQWHYEHPNEAPVGDPRVRQQEEALQQRLMRSQLHPRQRYRNIGRGGRT